MKNMIKHFLPLLLAGFFFSCEKEVETITYESGTPPVLTASTTAVRLEPGEEGNIAIEFNWTNPDYKFSTGVSSHDVVYTLEIDTAGANFNSKIKFATVISKDLSKLYTVGELNPIFGNTMLLQLNPRRTYNLEARIISSIVPGAVKLISNKVSFSAKPFAPPPKVQVPAAGTLWITGSAVASSWSNPLSSPFDVSQKFTQVSPTLYQITIPMIPGGGYKLIQEQGNWSSQYSFLSGDALSGAFYKADAAQFNAPSVAGTYKLTFDFQLGLFTAVKQ